jgi:hypothetical protein
VKLVGALPRPVESTKISAPAFEAVTDNVLSFSLAAGVYFAFLGFGMCGCD